MNKISRKGFLKIAAAAAMSGVTAGALAACNTASSSTAASSGAAGTYIPGTYEGTAEGISSTVKVTMTFSDSAVTDVVVDTSGETASYGAAAADQLREQLLAAGSAEIDGVSGSTITSDAVMKAAKSCYAQAKGEATVTSVQLPTGDENDWLGKEPDIDEAAITETVDTDILIVGAGNGGMGAAAYAAAHGLNFRVIEQNGNVQDTRHWVGAVDGFGAQAQGIKMDRAKLLSEISRYASGKCDQRVVKTWINESGEMIEFIRSIMEDKYGVKMVYTYGDEAKWPAENAEHNTDYMYPEIEYTYDRSSGAARNELLLDYIRELGYDVDFKTSLAKLEKDSTGRITGVIAQSTEDDHFIRYNANKGVLLACGGFPGNPYMMEQLDPLGTSVTTACSYSPADKGYGIRAAVWAGANFDKEAAPMLFDRGIVAPGVDGGYVASDSALGCHIVAVLMELRQLLHSGAAVPGQYGVRQAIERLAPGQTGHFADQLGSDLLAAPGALIQNGQAVSQRTVCNAGDQGGSIRRQFHALQSGHLLQAHRHSLRLNTLKVKALAPAENGGRQLVHLCGG